jgi:hypothetical protein
MAWQLARLLHVAAVTLVFLNLPQTLLAERTATNTTAATLTPPGECVPVATDLSVFRCKPRQPNKGVPCVDSDERCAHWETQGECRNNPQFMLTECRKSCASCLTLHVGVTQIAPDDDYEVREAIYKRLYETQEYTYKIMKHNVRSLEKCQNQDPQCTLWAVKGKCETHPTFMNVECAPACRTCVRLKGNK